jgi:hypothetical protein
MMTLDDLIAFLRARLDEDEAAAKKASSEHPAQEAHDGRWQDVGDRQVRYGNGAGETLRSVDTTGASGLWYEQISVRGDPDGHVAGHIARHDPARVLREVAAKRAIVTYEDRNGLPGINAWGIWRDMLKYLATAYSDHPDYQASWVMDVT